MTVQSILPETKKTLKLLAKKYEVASFTEGDPSCILKKYSCTSDIEIASFITALLSYGKREQFLQKVHFIFSLIDNAKKTPTQWIKEREWEKSFPSGSKKFYRFHSYDDLRDVFEKLHGILKAKKSFGEYLKKEYEKRVKDFSIASKTIDARLILSSVIAESFAGCKMVPQNVTSCNKRLHMFLRWMVRQNSAIDLGLWKWYSPANLIIPLDTHVLAQSIALSLLPQNAKPNAKTALLLTDTLKQIWNDDPCRGDFALFGLGVNQ